MSSEGIYRWELDQPICLTLPVAEQIDQTHCHLHIAEANATYAAMYDLSMSEAAVGLRLGDAHISTLGKNLEFLNRWVESDYRIQAAESEEVNPEGKRCYFLNNVIESLKRVNSLVAGEPNLILVSYGKPSKPYWKQNRSDRKNWRESILNCNRH